MPLLRLEKQRLTHLALSATWAMHHLTSPQLACWLLLPKHGHYGQKVQTVPKFLEASWPTGGVDAPTLPCIQGHQDGRGRRKRSDASLCSANNTKLLHTSSCMHIFTDFSLFQDVRQRFPNPEGFSNKDFEPLTYLA